MPRAESRLREEQATTEPRGLPEQTNHRPSFSPAEHRRVRHGTQPITCAAALYPFAPVCARNRRAAIGGLAPSLHATPRPRPCMAGGMQVS